MTDWWSEIIFLNPICPSILISTNNPTNYWKSNLMLVHVPRIFLPMVNGKELFLSRPSLLLRDNHSDLGLITDSSPGGGCLFVYSGLLLRVRRKELIAWPSTDAMLQRRTVCVLSFVCQLVAYFGKPCASNNIKIRRDVDIGGGL